MSEKETIIRLAGIALRIHSPYTFPPFAPYITDTEPQLEVSASEVVKMRRHLFKPEDSDMLVEYTLMAECVGRSLLAFDRCVFHGVSFLWRGKAWIFTAPSGTGKTTQYILWSARYGKEVRIMNGDKPILEWCSDGRIMVHPSPWRGKEGLGSMIHAPLGGIVLLEQGQSNTIRRLQPREAIKPVYYQFLFNPKDEESAAKVSVLEERMLRSIPVWLLTNRGDTESVELTHDCLTAEEEV